MSTRMSLETGMPINYIEAAKWYELGPLLAAAAAHKRLQRKHKKQLAKKVVYA